MAKQVDDYRIPDSLRPAHDAVLSAIDAVCGQHLNAEYAELGRRLTAALARKRPSPLLRGKLETWAVGIIRTIGWANFLHDPSQTPHMKSTEIAKGFRVSMATMQAKAKVIREGLDLIPFYPDWCLPSKMDDNPMVWMLEVNGILIDIRMAPH